MNYSRSLRKIGLGFSRPVELDAPDLEAPVEDVDRPEALRVGAHDTSRVEWVVTLPLDVARSYPFEIEFTAEIPANLISPHDLWSHFQELARLHSPDTNDAWKGASGNDDLRRATLAVIHKLKVLQDRHGRACMVANSLLLQEPKRDLLADLLPIVDEAVALIATAREKLADPGSLASVAERRLADEFLSTKLLDFLSEVEKDVAEVLLHKNARFASAYKNPGETLRERLGGELAAELKRRSAKGFLNPSGDSAPELEDYLDRASHLKKHFQEVLFLEMSTQATEHRLRNWVGGAAAILAALIYFVGMSGPLGLVGSGISLTTTALLGALLYALKDRFKEVFRGWLARRITHLYGTRTVTLRVPRKLDSDRTVLVVSRDEFTITFENRNDSLNPEVGDTRRMAILHYHKKGKVEPDRMMARELQRKGLKSIKQIFRYDLSPLFSRLDDPVKRVPVLDADAKHVRFVDAPRCYHFPVTTRLALPTGTTVHSGEIVVQKSGITRFDTADVVLDSKSRLR